jgi:hypothetical protein
MLITGTQMIVLIHAFEVGKALLAACSACCGPVKVIASIEDPVVISKILNHLKQQELNGIPSPSVQRALLPLGGCPRIHL